MELGDEVGPDIGTTFILAAQVGNDKHVLYLFEPTELGEVSFERV